jgi:hypothetical protein
MQENRVRLLRTSIVWFVLLFTLGGQSFGQGTMGGVLPNSNRLNRQHMAPTGKPCLVLHGYAKAQTINPNIFEHRVDATNSCGLHIKVKVCYHMSEDCITIDVPPWDRKDSVLGIYPALRDFKYDAKELF